MRIKAYLYVLVLMISVVCAAGCQTAKGVAVGVGATAIGVAEDTKTVWNSASQADAWMKKNLC